MRIEIQNCDGETIAGPRWNHLREHIFDNLLFTVNSNRDHYLQIASAICHLVAPLIGNVFLLFLSPVSGIVSRFLCHCSFFSASLSLFRPLFVRRNAFNSFGHPYLQFICLFRSSSVARWCILRVYLNFSSETQ